MYSGRFTQVVSPDGTSVAYVYDDSGNRVSSTAEVLFADNFPAGSAIDSRWASLQSGSWSIDANGLKASTTTSPAIIGASTGTNNDYTFQARIYMDTGKDVGIAFRIQSTGSYYFVRASGQDANATTLWKYNNGAPELIKPCPTYNLPAQGSWYTLKVNVHGSDISWSYFANGAWSELFTASDSSYAGGGAGLAVGTGGGSNVHHFDGAQLTTAATFTYNAANELTQIKDGAGTVTSNLKYDASGNNISEGLLYRLYDERNRLLESSAVSNISGANGAVIYTYDALGSVLSRSTRPRIFTDDFSTDQSWVINAGGAWSKPTDTDPANPTNVYKATSQSGATASWQSASQTDFTFSAKVKVITAGSASANAGLIFRSDNTTSAWDKNQYYFEILPALKDSQGNYAPQWQLRKVITTGGNSVWTTLDQGPAQVGLNRYYVLTVSAQGPDFKLYIDGALVTTVSDSARTSGELGLRVESADACFDDVRMDGPTSSSSVVTYRYNEVTGALMHELNSSGIVTVTYISDAAGNMIAVNRTLGTVNQTYYYHFNAHGDVTAITDANGYVVATYSYDAWGAPTEYDATGHATLVGKWAGTPGNGIFLLFGGMFYDAATGLYLTKTSEVDPIVGTTNLSN